MVVVIFLIFLEVMVKFWGDICFLKMFTTKDPRKRKIILNIVLF